MSVVGDALERLYEVLSTVEGVRLHRGIGLVIDPPGTTVGPPQIQRAVMGSDPTAATFTVAVIVAQTVDAMAQLIRLEQRVVDALQDIRDATVLSPTEPGTWPSGGASLPAQQIRVEFAL